MSTKRSLGLLGAAIALLLSWAATAADVTVFESCVDSRGKMLPAEADDQQAMLVRTAVDDQGQATIRYNPGVLPRLTFPARLFLYMHECSRHGLSGSGRMISAARARLADCMAVHTLVGSGQLKREDLPALQAELSFTEAEWQLLPGPMRNFDFANCQAIRAGNVLRLPVDTPPSEKQAGWNNCVRACADRLWTCQKRCSGSACDACLETHSQCKAACGGADRPAAEKAAD
jgi:hypothetical protein